MEDESSLSDLITLNLGLEGYKVDHFSDGEAAWKAFSPFYYDLVILDVMLPGMAGFTICQKIRLTGDEVPVLFLTAKNTGGDRVEGLKIGGDDYMGKPFNLDEFLLRVEKLIKRFSQRALSADVLDFQFGPNYIHFKTYEFRNRMGEKKVLTKKEAKLLKLFVERKNQVLSRDEIIQLVWNPDESASHRTIDNMVVNFRKNFEENPKKPKYFTSIRGVGYKFSYNS